MPEKKGKKPAKQKKKKTQRKDSHLWIGQGHMYQPEDANVRKDL